MSADGWRAASLDERARGVRRLGAFLGATALSATKIALEERASGYSLERRAGRAHQWGRRMVDVLGMRIERTGDVPRGGVIVVANHRSYADIAVLLSQVPCFFIGKTEVMQWPVIGWGAALAGSVFVHRNDLGSGAIALRELRERLRSGFTVAVFPEGTTASGAILPFHRGVFSLASAMGVPVVAAAIEYASDEDAWTQPGDHTFVPHFISCFGARVVPVSLAFSAPLVELRSEPLRRATEEWIRGNLRRPCSTASPRSR